MPQTLLNLAELGPHPRRLENSPCLQEDPQGRASPGRFRVQVYRAGVEGLGVWGVMFYLYFFYPFGLAVGISLPQARLANVQRS